MVINFLLNYTIQVLENKYLKNHHERGVDVLQNGLHLIESDQNFDNQVRAKRPICIGGLLIC